jgi:molybdate transport system regulatory protein
MKPKENARARIRIWIEAGGKNVFGQGRAELLKAVGKYGSLNKAAAALKMSYRAAWGKIKTAEKRLGFKLIKNPDSGRGSRLTPAAESLLAAFERMEKKIRRCAEREFGAGPKRILDTKHAR